MQPAEAVPTTNWTNSFDQEGQNHIWTNMPQWQQDDAQQQQGAAYIPQNISMQQHVFYPNHLVCYLVKDIQTPPNSNSENSLNSIEILFLC